MEEFSQERLLEPEELQETIEAIANYEKIERKKSEVNETSLLDKSESPEKLSAKNPMLFREN